MRVTVRSQIRAERATLPPATIGRYPDPVTFAAVVLGIDCWDKQEDVLQGVASHPRSATRAGHKVSKSNTAAILALWWTHDPDARPGGQVILTSSTSRQVRKILWKELRRLYRRAKARGYDLGGRLHRDPGTGLQWDDGREIMGFATDEPENMAGFSGKYQLFICDEASGIPAEIFEAIEGNRAGGATLCLFGNPTQTSGEFYDAFHDKADLYDTHHISSRDTPNVKEGREVIPGLATKAWVDEKLLEWGEDDPRFQVRVEGNFPGSGERNVFALVLIEDAQKRTPAGVGALRAGLDPARFGDDDSVLTLVRGDRCHPPLTLPKGDGPQVAASAFVEIQKARQGDEPVVLKVDIGGIGAAVYDSLRRMEAGRGWLTVLPVNSSNRAQKPDEYANARAEMHFRGVAWLKAGGCLPKDSKLKAEALAPHYDLDGKDRLIVEAKDEIKSRLGRSPDRLDSLLLALYQPPDLAAVAQSLRKANAAAPHRQTRSTW
jgi:phage terminase large subunit